MNKARQPLSPEAAEAWPGRSAVGETAPRFMLPDQGGLGWSLAADPVAGRPVVLVFVRGLAQSAASGQILRTL